MGKRKASGADTPVKESPAKEKQQQEEVVEDDMKPGQIDTNPLQFLVAPKDLNKFLSEHWEKKPLHIPADEGRKLFFDGLFNIDALTKLADQLEAGAMIMMNQDPGEKGNALGLEDDVDDEMVEEVGPLMFGRDVVAARYADGQREDIEEDMADSDTLRRLHQEGATLQLHQPQRFLNPLWRLLAALEAQAGCLAGCNAYLTPGGAQGLAPHHDDVEIFVCQTQGTKRWRVYAPVEGFQLPSRNSEDLPQEALGKPMLEVSMAPGDVLYLPRGYVHQAVAQEAGSCHLTLSTYQRWTLGDLAEHVVQTARESQSEPACLPLELRKGLPLGYLFKHGLLSDLQQDREASAAAAKPAAAALAAGLRALASRLESHPVELLLPASDALAKDFLRNRLPPHPIQLPDQGAEPTAADSLACRGTHLFAMLPAQKPEEGGEDSEDEGEEGEEEDDDDDEGEFVQLVTCLGNSRYRHMISGPHGGEDDEEDDEETERLRALLGGGSEDGDEGEEDEGEEEEEEGKEGAKDEAKEGGKEEEKAGKKVKAEEEKKEEKKEEKEEEKEEEGSDAEMGDADSDEGEGESDEDEDDLGSPQEEELTGPCFPAQYAPALAAILAATPAKPLPIAHIPVPGGDDEEKLRLAQLLWECGFVVTVAGKKAEEKVEEKAAGKEKQGKEGAKVESAKKEGKGKEAKGKPTPDKKAPSAEKKKEEKEQPAAKKAKRGK